MSVECPTSNMIATSQNVIWIKSIQCECKVPHFTLLLIIFPVHTESGIDLNLSAAFHTAYGFAQKVLYINYEIFGFASR